jgi:hypothetical protein
MVKESKGKENYSLDEKRAQSITKMSQNFSFQFPACKQDLTNP